MTKKIKKNKSKQWQQFLQNSFKDNIIKNLILFTIGLFYT